MAVSYTHLRPDVRLKQAMTGVNAIRSKYTRHSLKLSEVEIDMKLKEYFSDHDVLIRSDFQALCGIDVYKRQVPIFI